jgi:hypothetical protein
MANENIITNHAEIIIGTFVIGTLAFIVSHGWNDFIERLMTWLDKNQPFFEEKDENGLIYSAIYVVFITTVAIGVLLLLIKFDLVNHKRSNTK